MITQLEKYKLSGRRVLRLALPIVAGQLGMVLMGFFDIIQVGALGAQYIGASGIAHSVYFLFNLLGMGVLFAISPLVSDAFGEKNEWKSIGILRSGVKVALALSLLFFSITVIVIHYFSLFQEGPLITGLAQKFLAVLNLSTPMLMFFTLGKQFVDGTGRTRVSMAISLIGLVNNVFLNWVLIFGHLGCHAMGFIGAAVATDISRTLMCVLLFGFILWDKKVKGLREQYQLHKATAKSYVKQILEIGIPSGLQVFFEIAAFSAAQIMAGWLGIASLAAYQVTINMASITFMTVSGVAAAGTITAGYGFGKKSIEDIRIAGNTVYLLTFICQAFFAVVFLLFNHQLPHIYSSDAGVISLASTLLLYAAMFQLGDGFQVTGAGVLRGMQDVKIPSLIAFCSYWVIMVPLAYVLAFKTPLQLLGIWISFIIGFSIAAILMYLRFRYQLKHLRFTEL